MSDNSKSGESRDKRTDAQTTNNRYTTRRDALRLLGASAGVGAISSTGSASGDRDDDDTDDENGETSPWRLPGIVEAWSAGLGHTVAETPLATLRTPFDSRGYVGVIDDSSEPITLRLSVEGTGDGRLDLSATFDADRGRLLADRLDAGEPVEIHGDDPLLGGGGEAVTVSRFEFDDDTQFGTEYLGDGEVTLYVEVGDTETETRADAGVSLGADGAAEIAAGLRRAVARREGEQ